MCYYDPLEFQILNVTLNNKYEQTRNQTKKILGAAQHSFILYQCQTILYKLTPLMPLCIQKITKPDMLHKLMLFLMFFAVKAQSPSTQEDLAAGSFQANLAVVISVLACMFFLTFFVLVYAKFCRRSSPNDGVNQGQGLIRSTSRYLGVNKTVIESLPFFRFSSLKGSRKGLECAVCLSKFQDIELLRLLPKCKHAFHIACVDQWLEKHSSCPLCRHKVSTEDLTLLAYSNSLRFLGSHSDLRQDSNLELLVQREEDYHHGSSRFSRGSSFKGKNEEELPIQESCCEESLHKFNHKIIFSHVVLNNRWSSLSSSDLMSLNSEMINVMSSYRFSSSENEQFARKKEIEDGEVNKEMERKSKTNQTELVPFSGFPTTSKTLDPTEKRSMSEIVVRPRFTEFSMRNSAGGDSSSCPEAENNVKEERMRSLWLPIARTTVQWFANRERRSPQSQNARQSFHI